MRIEPKALTVDRLAPQTNRHWRPSWALQLALGVHAVVLVLVIVWPRAWPAGLAALGVTHVLLAAAGLWPRSRVLGPNLTRVPQSATARQEVVLSFDDGPDPEVTPQVLDLLDRYGAKASFFCVATRAAQAPRCVAEIVRRGHSVENHSDRHSNFFAFNGYYGFRRELARAQATLQALTGRAPMYFRAPMGIRNPLLDPAVVHSGLQYVSWTRRGYDAVERNPDAVLARLQRNLAAGDILLLHDGHAARTRSGEPVVLAVLPRLLENLAMRGLKAVSLPMALAS
ncbi:MAG: polysaccharide deacetylase family protein [Nevskia sp.]|nr:polysaccharide deacetylase family protein [Nevskia sp.]MCK9383449.1 polysaccharide deacetylase family protein [Nevskia sp.]